ncbi:hypothetical protein FNV43_RR13343 [Rhamnella rubrinervis]|uniref:Uncharacterized protein n=1 Tax=Rhamnella rubrinervis TaxID=2594499 RepID=A0A8K0H130_9ROSA|nr:hypothetical protein FNV43_RR13343 [Rhamnella rubrinervis]
MPTCRSPQNSSDYTLTQIEVQIGKEGIANASSILARTSPQDDEQVRRPLDSTIKMKGPLRRSPSKKLNMDGNKENKVPFSTELTEPPINGNVEGDGMENATKVENMGKIRTHINEFDLS